MWSRPGPAPQRQVCGPEEGAPTAGAGSQCPRPQKREACSTQVTSRDTLALALDLRLHHCSAGQSNLSPVPSASAPPAVPPPEVLRWSLQARAVSLLPPSLSPLDPTAVPLCLGSVSSRGGMDAGRERALPGVKVAAPSGTSATSETSERMRSKTHAARLRSWTACPALVLGSSAWKKSEQTQRCWRGDSCPPAHGDKS